MSSYFNPTITNTARVVLHRLRGENGRREPVFKVRGSYRLADTIADVAIDMGPAGDVPWYDLPLPPCPDCDGELHWAEAGQVPGARDCAQCRSGFRVDVEGDV